MNFNQMLIVFVLFVAAALVSPKVSADNFILGGGSYHLQTRDYTYDGERYKINEVNPSFGYRNSAYEVSLLYVAENSYKNESVALAWNPRWEVTPTMQAGLRLGVASGYADTPVDSEVVPIVGFDYTYDLGAFYVVLGFIAPEVITFHLEIPL